MHGNQRDILSIWTGSTFNGSTLIMYNIYINSNAHVVPDESNKFSMCLCCSIFPSPEQNPGLSHYQGLLNTGGSLPDLSNLHFPSPLSTPLDPEDNGGYPNLSGGSSTGNLPAAMMHLGIGNSQGGWSTALCWCVCAVSACLCAWFTPSLTWLLTSYWGRNDN